MKHLLPRSHQSVVEINAIVIVVQCSRKNLQNLVDFLESKDPGIGKYRTAPKLPMLQYLPEDLIYLLAVYYLEFEDLTRLRLTCKHLYEICSSHGVVLFQARHSFRRPLPVPPFRDLAALSSSELFRVLTKRSFLHRNWTSKPRLLQHQLIQIPDNREVIALALLQGGNHVLTWLRGGTMVCWDISRSHSLAVFEAGPQALFWWYRVGHRNQTAIILEVGTGTEWSGSWPLATFQIISLDFDPSSGYQAANFRIVSTFRLWQPRVLVAFVKTKLVASIVVEPTTGIMFLYVRNWETDQQAIANTTMLWPGEAINVYNHLDQEVTLYLERAGVAYTYDYSLSELFSCHATQMCGALNVKPIMPHTNRQTPFLDNLPTTCTKESSFSYFRGLEPRGKTSRVALTSILNQDDDRYISVAQHTLHLPLPTAPIPRYHFEQFENVTMIQQANHAAIPVELRDNLPMANAWRANIVWLQYDDGVDAVVETSTTTSPDTNSAPEGTEQPKKKLLKIATYPTVMGPPFEIHCIYDDKQVEQTSSNAGEGTTTAWHTPSPAYLSKHLTRTLPTPAELDVNQIMELELDDAHGLLAVSTPGGKVFFLYYA